MENINYTKNETFKNQENIIVDSISELPIVTSKWNLNTNEQYISSLSLTSPQTISSSAHLFDDHDDIESSKDSTLNHNINHKKENYNNSDITSMNSKSYNNHKKNVIDTNKKYSKAAFSHLISCITVLYAILAIVYSIVQETVQQANNATWQAEMILYTLMYGFGILFLIYCYLFIIYPAWYNKILQIFLRKNIISEKTYYNRTLAPTSHHGEGAGSLYLRLGILFFGSAGIVLFFLEIMLCFTCENCLPHSMINLILSGLFTFLQMHFIFCNSKIVVSKQRSIAKFGTMHLLAVNIWTWFRMVLAKKNKGKIKKILVENNPIVNITSNAQSTLKNLVVDFSPSSFDILAGSSVELIDDVINNSSKIASSYINESKNVFDKFNLTQETMKNILTSTVMTFVDNSTEIEDHHEMISIPSSISSSLKFRSYPNKTVLGKITAYEYFGDFTTFVITCIVEYSVIGAAIMFVMWKVLSEEDDCVDDKQIDLLSICQSQNLYNKNNDKSNEYINGEYLCERNSSFSNCESNSKESPISIITQRMSKKSIVKAKRKNRVSIDCSASSSGLFCGILFLICCFVSVLMYCVFYQQKKNDSAIHVFRVSDLIMFTVMLFAVIIGLFQITKLNYDGSKIKRTNSEFLDDLLLGIGLVGEQIHSCIGVIVWIGVWYTRKKDELQNNMEENSENTINILLPTQNVSSNFNINTLSILVFITRIIESTLQALFILIASRMKASSKYARLKKPGKQFVTFLLIANVSLFFFHTLEGMKCIFGNTDSQVTEDVSESRINAENYLSLVYAVSPLVIFYRFHSSVCLAEIWKHCYSEKIH
ncbi:Otopetrin family-containing protein [Strongyloides ratti]|uniref:Otopetrin family-containing protein n=1 Tax=Strongyloides ratti TaxID=34506 RepID=A0A090L2Q2_STRRB|nr:Otopetrin family-containing protein [Strongyloides ratti]CEF63987.1 Otopetrin family-containing protein [Strongyloides ratti]